MRNLIFIVVAILILYIAIMDKPMQTDDDLALNKAFAIGQYLIEKDFVVPIITEASEELRGPASSEQVVYVQKFEGEFGRDPWGYPFKYKVVKSDKPRLIVWSAGQNHKFDTSPRQVEENTLITSNLFSKDDRGVVLPLPKHQGGQK